MRRLTVGGLMLMSMLALGITATSASAFLPDLHVSLTGGTYPVHAEGACAACITELTSAGGVILSALGFSVLYLFAELSALGLYHAHIKNVQKGAQTCKTPGDGTGVVLVEEYVHLVFTELAPGLKVAALYLILNPLTITCGTVHVTVKGSVLGAYAGALNSCITEFKVNLLGEKGKQNIFRYEDNLGNSVAAELLADFGTGFMKAALNVNEEITAKVLENKMVEVLG